MLGMKESFSIANLLPSVVSPTNSTQGPGSHLEGDATLFTPRLRSGDLPCLSGVPAADKRSTVNDPIINAYDTLVVKLPTEGDSQMTLIDHENSKETYPGEDREGVVCCDCPISYPVGSSPSSHQKFSLNGNGFLLQRRYFHQQ